MKIIVKVVLGWVLLFAICFGHYWIGKFVYFVEDYLNFEFSFRYSIKYIFHYFEPGIAFTIMDGFLGFSILIFAIVILVLLSYLGYSVVNKVLNFSKQNESGTE